MEYLAKVGKDKGNIYFTLDGCIYFEVGFHAGPALPSLANSRYLSSIRFM